jgi:glucose 1-dehydrogenase
MSLKDKVAIVTGGNSGIGKAIALSLAKAGANIVIDYIADPDATSALERDIATLGDKAIGVDADVSHVVDLQKLIDTAVAEFGRVDIMVNNAGVETRTSVLDTTEAQYDRVLSINLKSAFFGTQIAARQMIKQGGGGRIINVTSVHEDWPMPGNTAYCLSKGGMRMLTRTAGVELAPRRACRRRRPRRGGDADQCLDNEGPDADGEARRGHPAWANGPARRDRQCCGFSRRRRR